MPEWQVIGQVPIDTARLALVDPMNADDISRREEEDPGSLNYEVVTNEIGVGVAMYVSTGLGDGVYPVEARFEQAEGVNADRRDPGQVPPASGGRLRVAHMRRACICGKVDCTRHGRRAWRQKPPANRYAYGGDWPERRRRVLERDGHACQLRYPDICIGRATQVDHIVQPEAGGTNALKNLRAVCRRCHARRTGRQGALAKQRAAQRRNPRRGTSAATAARLCV
jgi:hypothetical protein